MKVFDSLDSLPSFRNPAVTIGTFDGVHLGHQQILNELKKAAVELQGESVMLTFWPHPRMVLQPDANISLLNTPEEKKKLLEKTGLENLIIIPFTFEFSRTSYLHFIRDVLVAKLHVKHLVVGHDHHFGKNREGSYEELKECAPVYHFELTRVPALTIDGLAVSSSKIRNALQENQIEKANAFLGYTYPVSGYVIKGKGRGKGLGYPTANLVVEEKFKQIPADGIYAVEAEFKGHELKGMASIGQNPTFGDTGRTMEVNLFDFDKDIYGEKITLRFLAFLRKELKFASISELVKQLGADKEQTLRIFDNS